MSRISQSRRAIRALLQEALEQCQLHMDACPQARPQWESMAQAMHRMLEEMELRFSWRQRGPQEGQALFDRAQAAVLQWHQDMQRIRGQHPMDATLERLPDWPPKMPLGEARRPASA